MAISAPKENDGTDARIVSEFLITHSFPPQVGGLESYWRSVIERAGRPFAVLTNPLPAGEAEVAFANLEAIYRDRLWAWPVRPSWLPWWWRLPKIIKQLQPARVHIGHYTPLASIVRKRLPSLPMLVYLHGTDADLSGFNNSKRQAFTENLLHAKKVIVNSSFLAKKITSQAGLENLSTAVVYPGIAARSYVPDTDMQQDFLRKNNLEKGKLFISVSRLVKQKGIACSIQAFARFLVTRKDYSYCIFGDGPERQRLEVTAKTLGLSHSIHFMGLMPGDPKYKASIMSLARGLIMATSNQTPSPESFGVVALEAQASGTPVIISDAGGTHEAIVPQSTGLVCRADDAQSLAEQLGLLAADETLAWQMGERGKQHVNDHFDISKTVSALTALWDEC